MTNNFECSEGGKGDVIRESQQEAEGILPIDLRQWITCPKCMGRGTLPKETLPKIFPSREIKYTNEKKTYKSLALKESSLPILPSKKASPRELKKNWSTCTLPSIIQKRSISNISVESTTSTPICLLPPQITIDNINDHIRLTRHQFKSQCPNDTLSALRGLVHLFRQDINSVYRVIPEAYQRISDVLKTSTTTELTRLACQVIKMVSESITYISRPTFDEIITSLLSKTADNKMQIRTDANEAISSIVIHYPYLVVLRALTKKAPAHKHYLVRCSVVKSLKTTTEKVGARTILSASTVRDVRKKFLDTLCSFLYDNNAEVRYHARELTRLFVGCTEFYEALNNEIDVKILKQIEGIIVTLKSEIEVE